MEAITIKADYTTIITMAGPVKFYQNTCPYGKKAFYGGVAKVGSTNCQLCESFVEKREKLTEDPDKVEEFIICRKEKE